MAALPAEDWRTHSPFFTEPELSRNLQIVAQLRPVAADLGMTLSQLALAWVMAEPRVTCPIIGARNLEQLNDTMGGIDIALTPEERAAIPSMPSGRWVGVDPVYDRIS